MNNVEACIELPRLFREVHDDLKIVEDLKNIVKNAWKGEQGKVGEEGEGGSVIGEGQQGRARRSQP